jgi:hypothetical protein
MELRLIMGPRRIILLLLMASCILMETLGH